MEERCVDKTETQCQVRKMKIKSLSNVVIISGALAAFGNASLASDYRTTPYIYENSYVYESPYAYNGNYNGNSYRNPGYQERYYGNYPQQAPSYAYAPSYDHDVYYRQLGGYYAYYPEDETGYYHYPEDNDAGYYYGNLPTNRQAEGYYEDNDAYYAQYYQQQYTPADNDSDYVPAQRAGLAGDAQYYAVDTTGSPQENDGYPMFFDE